MQQYQGAPETMVLLRGKIHLSRYAIVAEIRMVRIEFKTSIIFRFR